jgi:hypothetical protein
MQLNVPDLELALASGAHFLRELPGFAKKGNVSAYA